MIDDEGNVASFAGMIEAGCPVELSATAPECEGGGLPTAPAGLTQQSLDIM